MGDPASVSTAWDVVVNKKEQERDLTATVTALNSSEQDPFCQGDCVEQFEERLFCQGDCSRQLVDHQEKQERIGEGDSCQRACSGLLVSSCDTVLRRCSFGRYWCLSCLAKRDGGGNPRVALKSGTGFPHDKKLCRFGGGRIRSQDCPGPASNVEATLGTTVRHSGQCQNAQRQKVGTWRPTRHSWWVDFRNCTVTQTRGNTAMTRLKSAAAHWLRKFGVEPVDFLPPRSGERDGVEVVARVQKECLEKVLRGRGEFGVFSRPFYAGGEPVPPPGCSEESESDRANHPWSHPAQQGTRIANQRKRLREGQIYTTEEARRFMGDRWEVTNLPLSWSKAAVQAFLSQWRRLTEQGRQGAPSLRQQCLLSITDCSTIKGARSSAQRSHENVRVHSRSLCGQNLAKPRQRANMKDITAVPLPAVPPAREESQVPRRVPMDTTSVGASLTQVQDHNQVATLPSPVSGS